MAHLCVCSSRLAGLAIVAGVLAALACQRPVALEDFQKLEVFQTGAFEVKVPAGLYPVDRNEALFRRLFGETEEGRRTFELLRAGGGATFLDPQGLGEGRSRMATFRADRAPGGCKDWERRVDAVAAAPAAGIEGATERIAGRAWRVHYDARSTTVSLLRCEAGTGWSLTFMDSKAADRATLLGWATESAGAARTR